MAGQEMKVFFNVLIVLCSCFILSKTVIASEKHHNHPPNVVNTPILVEIPKETTTINQYSSKGLSLAAGQHHYKSTTQLQWSVGAGYIDDDSAVSFGLGLQAGKVFVSGSFSSDGTNSAIGVGLSGTF